MREFKIAFKLPSSTLGTSVYMIRKKNRPGLGSEMNSFGESDVYYSGLNLTLLGLKSALTGLS